MVGNEANKIRKPSGKVQWCKPGCCREQHAASNAPWEKINKDVFLPLTPQKHAGFLNNKQQAEAA